MRIESGHKMTNDCVVVAGDSVRFVKDDGTGLFEVSVGGSRRSIEIRGLTATFIDCEFYPGTIDVRPVSANVVEIVLRPEGVR